MGTAKPTDPTAKFSAYHEDPVGFAQDVLGLRLWERQAEVAEAVAESTLVAVRSGHKVGKSTIAAALALWWVNTRPFGRVIMTSSGARQVKAILWRELRALYHRSKTKLGGEMHLDPGTGYRFDDGREVLGYTTNDAERMAGISGAELLFIVDEASGFDESIYEAVRGNMAGGAKLLALGNPTRTTGWFYDAFRSKAELWHTLHISSEESPNAHRVGEVNIPGLATREWLDDLLRECGGDRDHPVYMVRAVGDFPEHATDAVVGLADVQAAHARWRAGAPGNGPLRIGADPARYGDDEAAVQALRGTYAYPIRSLPQCDGPEFADFILRIVHELKRPGETAIEVRIDSIGVGASAFDALKNSDEARQGLVRVIPVNVGEASTDGNHVNLRSQLWFGVAEWLRNEGAIPPGDRQLERELLAPKFFFDARERKRVESKDDIKKRLNRSPDRADALCLAVYCGGAAYSGGYTSVKRSPTAGLRNYY